MWGGEERKNNTHRLYYKIKYVSTEKKKNTSSKT